jgi:DNA mismatch endonuclease, patch repair protein
MDRSANMRAIRSKSTHPELVVRKLVRELEYHFQLHVKKLPGKPDLVFPSRKKVIFVHGCFWHQHRNCKKAHKPKSNIAYWGPKLKRNQARDKQNLKALCDQEWATLIVWECQTQETLALKQLVRKFLGPSKTVRALSG